MRWYVVGAIVAGGLLLALLVTAIYAPHTSERTLVDLGTIACPAPHEGRVVLEAERNATTLIRYVVVHAEPGLHWSAMTSRAFAHVPGRAVWDAGEVLVADAPTLDDRGANDSIDVGDALSWGSPEAYRVEIRSSATLLGGTPRLLVETSFEEVSGRAGNLTIDAVNNESVALAWAPHDVVVSLYHVESARTARSIWTSASSRDYVDIPPPLGPGARVHIETIAWPVRATAGAPEEPPGDYVFAVAQGDPGGELCGVRFLRLP